MQLRKWEQKREGRPKNEANEIVFRLRFAKSNNIVGYFVKVQHEHGSYHISYISYIIYSEFYLISEIYQEVIVENSVEISVVIDRN